MKKQLWILLFAIAGFSATKAQTTGVQACVINGAGQPGPIVNSTTGYVLTILGSNSIGWGPGGSAPTGSGLFYSLSHANAQPYTSDTILKPQNGGTGYKNNQSNKFLVGNFYNAISSQNAGNHTQVKWGFFGDSFSEYVLSAFPNFLQNICGGIWTGFGGLGSGVGVTQISSVGVNNITSGYKYWPSGLVTYITNGGNCVYGVGGAASLCNKITIVTPKIPGGGTYEWKVTGGSYSAPISVAGTLGNVLITEIKLPLSTYTLQITNSTLAKDSVIFSYITFEDTAANGMTVLNFGTGGLQSDSCVNERTGLANMNQYLSYEKLTVFTQEWKDDSLYFGWTTDSIYNILSKNSALANTDVIGIGSTPVGNSLPQNLNQWVQNQQMQRSTLKYGFIYYDTYGLFGLTPLQAYNTLNGLGWDSGGVHVSNTCNEYRFGRMIQDLGFLSATENLSPYNISNNNIKTNIISITQQGTGIINGTILNAGANDLQETSNRDLYLIQAKGRNVLVGYHNLSHTALAALDDTLTFYAGSTITSGTQVIAPFMTATTSGSSFVGNATFGNTSSGGYTEFTKTGGSIMYILYNSTKPQISFSQPFQWVNQVTSVILGGLDTNGCTTQSIDTAQTITTGTIVVAHRGQNLELMGAAASVQITEPTGTLQKGDIWDVVTSKSTVSLTWTNSSHFYGTPPTTVTNLTGHEFMWDGTKWLQKY